MLVVVSDGWGVGVGGGLRLLAWRGLVVLMVVELVVVDGVRGGWWWLVVVVLVDGG